MDRPWKVIVAFVGVFIAGAIFGGLFTLRASGKRLGDASPPRPANTQPGAAKRPPAARPNPVTPQLMRAFMKRLNLTKEQNDRIAPIVGRAAEDYLRLSQRNYEDTSRVTERMMVDVTTVLTPEQRSELAAMRQKWLEELQRKKTESAKKIETPAPAATPPAPARPKEK